MTAKKLFHLMLMSIGSVLYVTHVNAQEVASSAPLINPPGFHLMFRFPDGRTVFKLGEQIEFDVGCNSDLPGKYSSPCPVDIGRSGNEIEVSPLDPKSKLAVDPVQTAWIDRALCPSTQYGCGVTSIEQTVPPVGDQPLWTKVEMKDHHPMSPGRFRIGVVTTGLIDSSKESFSASVSTEIEVIDDAPWRAKVLRDAKMAVVAAEDDAAKDAPYASVAYIPDLAALRWIIAKEGYADYAQHHPDRAAVAKALRTYLKTQANLDEGRLRETAEAILSLELAADDPALYARAVNFQNAMLEPNPDDVADLRKWLLPRYRELLLQIAEGMVKIHKNDSDGEEDSNLDDKAEELVRMAVPECTNTENFLSEAELRTFMQLAGRNPKFIATQIVKMRSAQIGRRTAE